MWRPDNMSCTQTHIYKAHATCNSWRAHPAELLETNCRSTDCSAVGHNLTGATRVNHGSTATKTSLQTSTFHFTTTTTVNRPSHLSWETECLPAILPALGLMASSWRSCSWTWGHWGAWNDCLSPNGIVEETQDSISKSICQVVQGSLIGNEAANGTILEVCSSPLPYMKA